MVYFLAIELFSDSSKPFSVLINIYISCTILAVFLPAIRQWWFKIDNTKFLLRASQMMLLNYVTQLMSGWHNH